LLNLNYQRWGISFTQILLKQEAKQVLQVNYQNLMSHVKHIDPKVVQHDGLLSYLCVNYLQLHSTNQQVLFCEKDTSVLASTILRSIKNIFPSFPVHL
jgi:hypothetical protein